MAVASPSTVMNNVEAVRHTLYEALKNDERTLVLGEDVGARGNVFLITKGFIEEFGAERVIDTPLAEASIVGVAIGMAMEGLRPIAEIQFADFIYPAFNQIVGEAAKTRYRSNGDYTCPLVIRTPYGVVPLGYQGSAQRGDRRSRSRALPRTQEDVSSREG